MINEVLLKKQITFTHCEGNKITGYDKEKNIIEAIIPTTECYQSLPSLLYKGCKLNLLSVTSDNNGILHPRDIILMPDYLIDISALSRCVQSYGSPAIGYILNMLEKSEESAARLLGEASNMFLDDCINSGKEQPATYKNSIQKFFREYPLALSVCNGIDKTFFIQTETQFHNIQSVIQKQESGTIVSNIKEDIYLEPSFFCETLGLQGRIDLLQNESKNIIELKSGKADEFRKESKEEHRLQMSLYKEMLCYNMEIPHNSIKAHLFYSRYPLFFNNESSTTEISYVLMLRNKIITVLRQMSTDGLMSILRNISPDEMNERHTTSKLWNNYQRPRIEKILIPIRKADKLLCEYIFGNIAFVIREMLHAKASENIRNNGRSFADIWRLPLETKKENGNILFQLTIKEIIEREGISDVVFNIPQEEGFFPNFRAGDTVLLYRCNNERDNATNNIVTRGTISEISPKQIIFHLRHKQRNRSLFLPTNKYAIEHDQLDSTFRTTLHNLYSLFTAPKQRTDLLLAQREPQFDYNITLIGDYGEEYINNIVLKAKQAKDLFMLVGPPGTGKTSQALRNMVQEFLKEGNNILLTSYTNRAIDEICQTLENIPLHPEYIRVGNEQNCQKEYRHRLLKNVISECKNRESICEKLKKTTIFIGTTASITANKELFRIKKFDVAIIDEATQILESQLAGLISSLSYDGATAINKFILIGDPKQLPAVVSQPTNESKVKSKELQSIGINDYGTSLFERMYNWYYNKNIKGLTATLYKQGRMHPEISQFANKHFYSGTLQAIPLPHQQEELQFKNYNPNNKTEKTIATKRTAFIPTAIPPKTTPKTNSIEAEAIAEFVSCYYHLNINNNKECNPSKEIGIIVPFRNQIAMIMRAIEKRHIPNSSNIVIDTVERFQGSQREMILFGTTITQKEMIETLSSPIPDATDTPIDRKLNVALTRARRFMYIFGNVDTLSASPIYRTLIHELG